MNTSNEATGGGGSKGRVRVRALRLYRSVPDEGGEDNISHFLNRRTSIYY